MQSRTSETIVAFRFPFWIGHAVSNQSAGSYRIVKEEELIDGLSFPAYHLISVALQIPAIGVPTLTKQLVEVSNADLEAALARDLSQQQADQKNVLPDATSMAARARNFNPTVSADNDNLSGS